MHRPAHLAVALAALATTLIPLTSAAAAPAAMPSIITCDAANVRTAPAANARLVGTVYRGDAGSVTSLQMTKPLAKGGHITHWYGTWRKGKSAVTGWIVADCAR